jgi:hypothetical protein
LAIETGEPYSDGWWMNRLYDKLRKQQADCDLLWQRYIGNPPLPIVSENQRDAVKWFVRKSRTNFERLIVQAVLSRLRIRGIRTKKDDDEGGDAEAFKTWTKARGKSWSRDAHKLALAMRCSYVIVGKHPDTGKLLVTAEDPRMVTAVTDPADPQRVLAALKLIYDPAKQQDVAYLYLLDGDTVRIRVARRNRGANSTTMWPNGYSFNARAFDWSTDEYDQDGNLISHTESSEPEWLQAHDGLPALNPVVVFENEDGMAEFEPHVELLDRINQQILQRMTIATVQAFRQRAFKGLPQTDPKTGERIDYDSIFVADPGAIWNIPASVDIWESGIVDLQPILLAIRDDVKDLAAVSGTPLYSVTPDVANGSAEGASLQRETLTFKVESRQDFWELSHQQVAELIFRTEQDVERSEPDTTEIMWAPADRPSMTERANAIAQTKGVIPRYIQMTEIWGMDPAMADRAMGFLAQDMAIDAAMAAAAAPAGGAAPGAAPRPGQGQQIKQLKPNPTSATTRPKGLPDVTKPPAVDNARTG